MKTLHHKQPACRKTAICRPGWWLAAAGLWLAGATAWGANVLQTFFVPLPEDQMQISLNAIDAYRGYIGDEMRSAISIVVGTDGTVIYYDH